MSVIHEYECVSFSVCVFLGEGNGERKREREMMTPYHKPYLLDV